MKKLKPHKLKVTPGYYDSYGNYHQNRNDLPIAEKEAGSINWE